MKVIEKMILSVQENLKRIISDSIRRKIHFFINSAILFQAINQYIGLLSPPLEKSITLNKNFDRNVLGIVCLAGFLRIVIEMTFLNTPSSGILDFYLDIAYGFIFLLTLFALWRNYSYRVVSITFYVPLVVLLGLTLYDRRGLASSIENNIFVGLIIIALTMRSKDARKYSIYLILVTIFALAMVEMRYHFFEEYSDYSTAHFNYIFMSIGVIIVTYYTKSVFETWKRKHSIIRKELSENHAVLASSQAQLEAKTRELEVLNKELEDKVTERLLLLKEQKDAMRKYLDLTSKELQDEHQGIHELTRSIVGTSQEELHQMMLVSSEKLENEIKTLVSQLKDQR